MKKPNKPAPRQQTQARRSAAPAPQQRSAPSRELAATRPTAATPEPGDDEVRDLTTLNPDFASELADDAGRGVSTDVADNIVPLIYVLQANSPQCIPGDARIEGAGAGDIWLKNSAEPVIPGEEGFYFMPCTMYQRWTEWIPRSKGGGFVGSYDYRGQKNLPEGAVRDESVKNKPRFVFPDSGNECVDTRYEAGIAWVNGLRMPYVIPFKSTGHSVSKSWMTKRTSLQAPNGRIYPAWTHLYRLTTAKRTNKEGTWFVFDVGSPVGYIPGIKNISGSPIEYQEGLEIIGGGHLLDASYADQLAYVMTVYRYGKVLANAFDSGDKRAAEEEETGELADELHGQQPVDGDGEPLPY